MRFYLEVTLTYNYGIIPSLTPDFLIFPVAICISFQYYICEVKWRVCSILVFKGTRSFVSVVVVSWGLGKFCVLDNLFFSIELTYQPRLWPYFLFIMRLSFVCDIMSYLVYLSLLRTRYGQSNHMNCKCFSYFIFEISLLKLTYFHNFCVLKIFKRIIFTININFNVFLLRFFR